MAEEDGTGVEEVEREVTVGDRVEGVAQLTLGRGEVEGGARQGAGAEG